MPLTPYLNKIICGDCLEVMRGMPDKCVDLVLTDPPYGIGVNHNMGRRHGDKTSDYMPATWDKDSIPSEYFQEIFRISMNQIIFGANHFISKMPLDSSCWIVWDKGFSCEVSFAQVELAWTSFNSSCKQFTKTSADKNRTHPTQKPVALGKWIISKYAKPGQIIFDPFMGSGSFLVAALQLGHPWIGCDNNPDYCRMAEERIAREAAQLNMFHTRTAP